MSGDETLITISSAELRFPVRCEKLPSGDWICVGMIAGLTFTGKGGSEAVSRENVVREATEQTESRMAEFGMARNFDG